MSRVGSWFIIMLVYIVVAVMRAGKKPAKSSSRQAGVSPPSKTAVPATPSPVKKLGRRAKDDCEYGEVNHNYSHDGDRRVAQLDGYLKAGLIDKKEYAQMLERYHQQDQAYNTNL